MSKLFIYCNYSILFNDLYIVAVAVASCCRPKIVKSLILDLPRPSSLVPSVGNRDRWNNNGSAVPNGDAKLTRPRVRMTDEGLWKSQILDCESSSVPGPLG
jgi:hypothetical protein